MSAEAIFEEGPLTLEAEAEELDALARAISMADGFKLLFARCDSWDRRFALAAQVRARLKGIEAIDVVLPERPIDNLLDELRDVLPAEATGAVFVFGVERSMIAREAAARDRFVSNLNAARNSYPATVRGPMVLWLSEPVLRAIAQGAPDFFSIRSGTFSFNATGEPGSAPRRDGEDGLAEDDLRSVRAILNDIEALEPTPEALAANIESVERLRRRAGGANRDFMPQLAASLNNLSNRLQQASRLEEALDASREAVTIYGELFARQPDIYRSDNAMALAKLAEHLGRLGQREEALAASNEAVALYRQLAAGRPDAFTPGLASSLNNLSNHLSALGQREEALAAITEAVSLYRQLAAQSPDAFTPNLAASLNNLGAHLRDLGQRRDALAACNEAVSIYRQLAARRPDTFKPDLAMSLNNLSAHLSDLGDPEQALDAGAEAGSLYRHLAAERPDAFAPDLATSLNNRAAYLRDLGRLAEALAACTEAVSLYRQLASQRPDMFTPGLTRALGTLGTIELVEGRPGDASRSFVEALTLIAPLEERLHGAFDGLVGALAKGFRQACEILHVSPEARLAEIQKELSGE